MYSELKKRIKQRENAKKKAEKVRSVLLVNLHFHNSPPLFTRIGCGRARSAPGQGQRRRSRGGAVAQRE